MAEYKTIVVLLLGFFSYSSCTEVSPCPGEPEPKFVSVEGCDKEPCTLYNGVGANMNITFESLTNTYTLKPRVRATVGAITIPFPMPGDLQDACKYILNGYCPIEKGEVLVYNLQMPLNYPTISLRLEFSLLGDNNVVYQCFRIQATVANLPLKNNI